VAAKADEIHIGQRVELFVDDYLVDRVNGDAMLVVKRPQPREVVFVADRPWEGSNSLYFTVLRDKSIFRMYYRGLQVRDRVHVHPEFVCYAESRDGIHWKRPNLGLVEFKGSKRNNIIRQGVGAHNFAPFRDDNPNASPQARYKAVGRGVRTADGETGSVHQLFAFQSPDGIHWKLMQSKPVLTNGRFDSQNVAFWDQKRRQYVCYFRDMLGGYRAIRTAHSSDFLEWKGIRFLGYRGAKREHLYTSAIQRYDRASHLLVGFPTRILPRSNFPDRPDWTEPMLIAGRDGYSFKHWPTPIIPAILPRQQGNRSNYASWGLVRIPSEPGRYSIYASESRRRGHSMQLRRYSYRQDGFVAAEAKQGELVTRPFVFDGDHLIVNFKTKPNGFICAEIQDASGKALSGLSLAKCRSMKGDQLAGQVVWQSQTKLSRFAGRPVRLRFKINSAAIYSFQFKK